MPEAPITRPQLQRLQTLMGKLSIKDGVPKEAKRTWRLAWVARRLELTELASFSDIGKGQAEAILKLLDKELPGESRRSRRRSGPEAGRAGRKSRVAQP